MSKLAWMTPEVLAAARVHYPGGGLRCDHCAELLPERQPAKRGGVYLCERCSTSERDK